MITAVALPRVSRGVALLLGMWMLALAAESAPNLAAQERRDDSCLTGSLVIESTPAGARIFLNGNEVGRTPLRLATLDPGLYALRLSLDGYRERNEWVRVSAGRETALQVPLVSARGTLVIPPTVPDMEIRLGSRWVPAGTHPLPPGRYRIPLRAPGYAETIVSATIEDGAETVVLPELIPGSPADESTDGHESSLPTTDAAGSVAGPTDRPGSSWQVGGILSLVPRVREAGRADLFVAAGSGGSGSPSFVSTMVGASASVISRLTLGVAAVVATDPSAETPRFGGRGSLLVGPYSVAPPLTAGLSLSGGIDVPGGSDVAALGLPIVFGPVGPGISAGIIPAIETDVGDPMGADPSPAITLSAGIRRRRIEIFLGGHGTARSPDGSNGSNGVWWAGHIEGRIIPDDGILTVLGTVQVDRDSRWWGFFGSGIAF